MTNNILGPAVGLPVQPKTQEPGFTSQSFKRWLVENLRAARKNLYSDVGPYPTLGLGAANLGNGYNIPANLLAQTGEGLYINVRGIYAANANNKTLLIAFGGVTIVTTGALAANATFFELEVWIYRVTSATQRQYGKGIANNAVVNINRVAGALDLTAAQLITINATTPTAIGDLTVEHVLVEKLDQPNFASGAGGVS